jgi:hypothetical protein
MKCLKHSQQQSWFLVGVRTGMSISKGGRSASPCSLNPCTGFWYTRSSNSVVKNVLGRKTDVCEFCFACSEIDETCVRRVFRDANRFARSWLVPVAAIVSLRRKRQSKVILNRFRCHVTATAKSRRSFWCPFSRRPALFLCCILLVDEEDDSQS